MFSKLALFAAATFAVVASAAPLQNSCNVGTQQCCNSVQSADNKDVKSLLGLLNIDVSSITGQVGLGCNPISVIGLGGNSCNAQPVCCEGNNFNGLVAVGCTPIAANL